MAVWTFLIRLIQINSNRLVKEKERTTTVRWGLPTRSNVPVAMLLIPLLLLPLLLQLEATATPPEPAPSWSNSRAPVSQQTLQTVLMSIEERLRALDTLYSPRLTPRWEISIEQQSRRLETIESRLGRLETLLELRLDKLSETLSARQLKEELSHDQINRKLDSTYERLNHRMSYLEARLDMSVAKLQSTTDTGVGRMERLETTAAGRQNDIEAELADIGTGIEEIKKHLTTFEQLHNRSLVTVIENGRYMAVEMNNLTTLVEDLHVEFNKTQAITEQNDGERTDHQEELKKNIDLMADKVISSIDRNSNNFMTKVNNMYNDVWRRIQVLEGLVKDSMSLSNATRRELQDGIRTVAVQIGRRGLLQSDRDRQEGSMDIALDTLGVVQRRLNELGRKFDSSFQMLMLAQNLFLESCHRIQLDEPQLESKLTKVLERILDAITNRSMNTDRQVQTLQEVFKSHSSQLTRILNQATTTMQQASEQNKLLHLSIAGIKEQLLEGNRYIEEAISDIKDEDATHTERLLNMAASLQELQESIGEVPINNAVVKHDKYDTVDCPDSEQLAVEILAQLKRRGVTVNHQITKEHIKPETETDKDTDTEADINDSYGTEELFGEEANEETEQNPDNRQAEPMTLQILHSPNNTSEEGDVHNEKLNKSINHGSFTANTNLMLNSSSFQRHHRFDLQTNKNSTKEKAESIKPARVAIHVIPHNINLQVGENSGSQVLERDWNNIAAIIQTSDSTVTPHGPQSTFAFIHATASNDKNKINITQINTDNKHLQPNVNATLHGELNYVNGTFAYNQSENSDVTHSTEVYDRDNTAAGNHEEMKSNYHSSDATQVPLNPALSPLITNPHKSEHSQPNHVAAHISGSTLLISHSKYNSSPSGQIFNISQQEHIMPNTTNIKHISELNPNNTEAATVVQVSNPLTRLMELYSHEGKINFTLLDFWRDLMVKNTNNHTSIINDLITFSQNNSENDDTALVKHKPSAIINTDRIQNLLSALRETAKNSYDAQRQQYLTKLQELAMELVSRKDGPAFDTTDHFQFANTTDDSTEATANEGNNT